MSIIWQKNSTVGTPGASFLGVALDVGGTAAGISMVYDSAGTGINTSPGGGQLNFPTAGSRTKTFTHVWQTPGDGFGIEISWHESGAKLYYAYFGAVTGKLRLNNEGTGGPNNIDITLPVAANGTAYTWVFAYDAPNGRLVIYQNGTSVYDSGTGVWPRGDAGANNANAAIYYTSATIDGSLQGPITETNTFDLLSTPVIIQNGAIYSPNSNQNNFIFNNNQANQFQIINA